MTTLINPRMLSALSPTFYPSSCQIETPTESQDSAGQPIPSWAAVSGMTALACAVAVPGAGQKAEIKRPDGTIVIADFIITLASYRPTITEKMRAVVGGVTYDIVGVDFDSHQTMTRLVVIVTT